MYITIGEPYRQSFLSYAARWTETPCVLRLSGDRLHLGGLSPHLAAAAAALGPFRLWERRFLSQLARDEARFSPTQGRRLVELGAVLLAEDSRREGALSGPRRLSQAAGMMEEHLLRGGLDFQGFCRFALPGHRDYLCHILTLAADQLLAEEEDAEYLDLLRRASRPKGEWPHVYLLFYPRGLCRIWVEDKQGRREREGGCFRGREDMLISIVLSLSPALVLVSGGAWLPLTIITALEEALEERLVYREISESALTNTTDNAIMTYKPQGI